MTYAQHRPKAQPDAFEILASLAKWVDEWSDVFKDNSAQLSEKVQVGLNEKRLVHVIFIIYALWSDGKYSDFMVKLFDWAYGKDVC